MLEAARAAVTFTSGMSQADFLKDKKTQAAVMMSFIIIGEAARRVAKRDPDFLQSHADWPWVEMRGLRNRGAHGYETIDFKVLWNIVAGSIPVMVGRLEALGNLDPREERPG